MTQTDAVEHEEIVLSPVTFSDPEHLRSPSGPGLGVTLGTVIGAVGWVVGFYVLWLMWRG